jgi:hypothetical protein
VLTVAVKAEGFELLSTIEAGDIEQVAAAGAPLQLRDTVPLKPPEGTRVRL